jgi:nicotinamidase-related amidase
VQNSEGAAIVDGLDTDKIDFYIKKGQEKLIESYSAFTDPWGLLPNKLEKEFKDAGIIDVFVVGLGTLYDLLWLMVAEDFCVKYSALDAQKMGFKTVVVEDCTKGVSVSSSEFARKQLKEDGVEYLDSRAVKELFSE